MTNIRELVSIAPEDRTSWNSTLESNQSVFESSTVISRFEFVDMLDRILVPEGCRRRIWSLESGGDRWFFPCYIEEKSNKGFNWRGLKHMPDLYPGRTGPAWSIGEEAVTLAFLDKVFGSDDWDHFSLRILADSPMETHLLHSAGQYGIQAIFESETDFPYINLPESWDELYSGFSKKFRYNIRNSQQLLSEQGELVLDRVVDAEKIPGFLEDAYRVERESWKEAAGTSLTTNRIQEKFHSALAPATAESGIFRGYVLRLDGVPIAHVYGLLCGGVFYSLKLSHSEKYRTCSPGTALTALALRDLIASGVEYWDYSGPTEDYKRRWAKEAYCLRTYSFYNGSWRGRLLKLRRKAKDLLSSK